MATTKKKRPGARSSAKKSAKKAVKSAKKAAPGAKRKAPPVRSSGRGGTPAKKASPAKKRLPSRDVPVPQDWLIGTLTLQEDVLGVVTASGFVSLETLANAGEKIEVVLQLGQQRTGDVGDNLRRLIDFIEARAGEATGIIVRCCVS